jgi:hypothetical protein
MQVDGVEHAHELTLVPSSWGLRWVCSKKFDQVKDGKTFARTFFVFSFYYRERAREREIQRQTERDRQTDIYTHTHTQPAI